jgi:hypothetical protein
VRRLKFFRKDKVVPEARNWQGAPPDNLTEAALGADAGALGKELESLFRSVQQPVSRRKVVPRGIAPVTLKVASGARLDDVIHRRREPPLCSP